MSTSDAPTRGPARRLPYVVAGVLLAVAIVAPLLVPLYARTDPRLYGMPFFYWYQILSVFIEALILWAVYLIVTREDTRRRAAVRDLPPTRSADDATGVTS
ncbi:DUF3311 domain-containing protein [Lacisediminihabitans profunda]|uniref:DUF3311 domain-containing protein n=1 Tax=Lacisediminihabitans profunda TaxID=2594790 RepID=A0A5C8UPU7_9MICO|nr:DUF3311 domain-containing protein [Lacisediminihabitans profunda]TXN29914.1 DUF3311 domain-containing protein [Lacisediminihabitans profunda]